MCHYCNQIVRPNQLGAGLAEGAAVYRFTTRDWSRPDRFERWREIVARAVMRMEIEPGTASTFDGAMFVQALPGLRSAFGFCNTSTTRRTSQLIDNDDLILSIVVEGSAEFRQAGRQASVGAGDAVLASAGEIIESYIPSAARMKLLRMPRAALAPLVKDIDAAIMRVILPSNHPLQVLSGYSNLIRAMGDAIAPDAAQLAARHMHDLTALALGCTRDASAEIENRGLKATRLALIRADIVKSANQPHLSIAMVAQRHGLSTRSIQMTLAEAGTTFSDMVMEERLDRAYRLLSTADALDKSIATIALEVGFSDLSYFHRSFRRRHGVPPGEVRAAIPRTSH